MQHTIKSTLKFDTATTNGQLEKTNLTILPLVAQNKDGQNVADATTLPPVEQGVIWLVNAAVFAATDRPDFIMFDRAQTVRDADDRPVAQGGFVRRDGTVGSF